MDDPRTSRAFPPFPKKKVTSDPVATAATALGWLSIVCAAGLIAAVFLMSVVLPPMPFPSVRHLKTRPISPRVGKSLKLPEQRRLIWRWPLPIEFPKPVGGDLCEESTLVFKCFHNPVLCA